MINYILSFFILTSSLAWAGVQTDSHVYISSGETLLIIDRKTNQEERINVGFDIQPMVIHGDNGYLVGTEGEIAILNLKGNYISRKHLSLTPDCEHYDSLHVYGDKGFILIRPTYEIPANSPHYLLCIDLIHHTILMKMSLKNRPECFSTYKDKGFILSTCPELFVINLRTCEQLFHHQLNGYPMHPLVHYKSTGFVNLRPSGVLSIDLHTGTPRKTIELEGLTIHPMVIVGDFGYVPLPFDKKIKIIDLTNLNVVQTMSVPAQLNNCYLYGNAIYSMSNSPHSLIKLNLNPFGVQKIMLDDYSRFVFFKNYIIVKNSSNKIYVISLKEFQIIDTYSKPTIKSRGSLYATDRHVYCGTIKIFPGPLRLFTSPFKGIDIDLWADGDDAFGEFEDLINYKEFDRAVKPFQIALSTGHPKACAWAAYAFSHECFGAEIDVEITGQFWVEMDHAYYKVLSGLIAAEKYVE